jgi:hypothetical protein
MPDVASGHNAKGVCDVCGFTYRLRELKNVIIKGRQTNIKACSECWDLDHPQLKLGEVLVRDPQSLRDPRPDNGQYGASRAQIQPVLAVVGTMFVGTVTVETS